MLAAEQEESKSICEDADGRVLSIARLAGEEEEAVGGGEGGDLAMWRLGWLLPAGRAPAGGAAR